MGQPNGDDDQRKRQRQRDQTRMVLVGCLAMGSIALIAPSHPAQPNSGAASPGTPTAPATQPANPQGSTPGQVVIGDSNGQQVVLNNPNIKVEPKPNVP